MAEKMKLIDDLLTIFVMTVVVYNTYRGITLSGSPNFFKEFLGSLYFFFAFSGSTFLIFNTIYYVSKRNAQRHRTVRPPKAGANVKRIIDFLTRMLVPFAIVSMIFMTMYFLIALLASAFLFTLSKNPILFTVLVSTALTYIVIMYYGIDTWRYKRTHKLISTS